MPISFNSRAFATDKNMEPVISVKNLSKKYNITHQKGRYVALRDILSFVIQHPIKTLRHRAKKILGQTTKEDFWALKDINFEIHPGEAVGIIGANGAGKSTILKILSRITPPTFGEVVIRGRLSSLLEVGTGFHPELTGRENIFLNGAILGMTRRDIAKKFDDIVKFANLEQFIDTPVKRYSTGMYVRLAFSVAAHIEPDILLVDEVLAVGDAEFQKKCIGKMEEVTGKAGRTILFVSHNMSAVEKLCPKTILLDRGQIVMAGETKKVIACYLERENQKSSDLNARLPITIKDVTINHFKISQKGVFTNHINCDEPFKIDIGFKTHENLTQLRAGIYIKNSLGDILFRSCISDWQPDLEKIEKGEYEARLEFPGKLLRQGSYFINMHLSRYGILNYMREQNLEKTITVGSSAFYNQAHPTEKPEGQLLLDKKWDFIRR